MPLSPTLAAWLRDRGHDAVHVADLGLGRASDSDLLKQAKQEGRTIITADLDYPRLLAMAGATEPSLILFRDGNWADADILGRMDMLLHSLTEDDLAMSIIVVERDRVRRRRLPLGP